LVFRPLTSHKEGYEISITKPDKEPSGTFSCDYVFYVRLKIDSETEYAAHKGSFRLNFPEDGEEFTTNTDYTAMNEYQRMMGMVLRIKHGEEVVRTIETKVGLADSLDRKIKNQK